MIYEYKITGYKPEKLFHFFEDISAIPRALPTRKQSVTISWHLPKNEIWWYHRDALFNVIIKSCKRRG